MKTAAEIKKRNKEELIAYCEELHTVIADRDSHVLKLSDERDTGNKLVIKLQEDATSSAVAFNTLLSKSDAQQIEIDLLQEEVDRLKGDLEENDHTKELASLRENSELLTQINEELNARLIEQEKLIDTIRVVVVHEKEEYEQVIPKFKFEGKIYEGADLKTEPAVVAALIKDGSGVLRKVAK